LPLPGGSGCGLRGDVVDLQLLDGDQHSCRALEIGALPNRIPGIDRIAKPFLDPCRLLGERARADFRSYRWSFFGTT
jgi:hypothetical protein